MKFLSKISKGFAVILLSTILAIFLGGGSVSAIPYSGDTTPSAENPAFNVYTDVPSEGNEPDFFRGKVEGDTNPSVSDVQSTCETGKRFMLRVYVHNGASQYSNGNGDGPSVAKNSKVTVNLNNASSASNFSPNASISASNAATVNDGMTITCTDGKTVNLNYVAGTAKQFTRTGSKALSDSIVTTGATIGTDSPNGDVWGCWEQRVYVTLVVQVEEVKEPPVVPSDAICKIENGTFAIIDRKKRTVKGTIKPELTNATVTDYEIQWGDGTKTNKQTDSHSYNKDGTYKIQATITVRLNDGSVKKVNGVSCATVVVFDGDKPPVIVPPEVTPTTPTPPTTTTLPSTGAGGIFGIFTATSLIGAVLHRLRLARKLTV
ncbi:hypothetical protein KDA11_05345 [Candidatus Saccharibacteria bacterium]|nr:hypothetical protein [Candidatus Saccharibacteria bacterium]